MLIARLVVIFRPIGGDHAQAIELLTGALPRERAVRRANLPMSELDARYWGKYG